MKIGESPIYSFLDRGDGICKYFDYDTKLCSIYDERPVMCNIDGAYEFYFKEKISLEEYYRLNYEICNMLKKQAGGRKNVFESVKWRQENAIFGTCK